MVAGATPPEMGDVVWRDFSPTRGHEQAGRRPALVLTPRHHNDSAGIAIVCPLTNQSKGHPYEVILPASVKSNVALVDQIRSVAWHERHAEFIESVPNHVLEMVGEKLSVLMPFYGD